VLFDSCLVLLFFLPHTFVNALTHTIHTHFIGKMTPHTIFFFFVFFARNPNSRGIHRHTPLVTDDRSPRGILTRGSGRGVRFGIWSVAVEGARPTRPPLCLPGQARRAPPCIWLHVWGPGKLQTTRRMSPPLAARQGGGEKWGFCEGIEKY
jgi:hypothetical protein